MLSLVQIRFHACAHACMLDIDITSIIYIYIYIPDAVAIGRLCRGAARQVTCCERTRRLAREMIPADAHVSRACVATLVPLS